MALETVELDIDDEAPEDEVPVEYDIATYPSDFTLAIIRKMWKDEDIEIPNFQRQFVWKIEQASLLIESFLLGLPVPPVFFHIDNENRSLVIDGQQRILSTVYFQDGYFGEESAQGKRRVFRLAGLDETSLYHNKRFEDLSDSDQRKLENAVLRAINVRQLSPGDDNTSIYHIFERLNTGGTPLKPQEIRNCVFRGKLVETLHTLNKDANWRRIVGRKEIDKHQRDIELILRIFALGQGCWEEYEKPMKEYLNLAMKGNRNGSKRVDRFVGLFRKVCDTIVRRLDNKPFHIRGPLNAAVLDSVCCILLDHKGEVPDNLPERYQTLVRDESFLEGTRGSTTNTQLLKDRFSKAKEHLIE